MIVFLPVRTTAALCAGALLLAGAAAFAQGLPDAQPPAASRRSAPASAENGLSTDLFYRILLGDIALQRGEPQLAARAFYEAAREARDDKLARRATEIALAIGQRSLAEAAARLWQELDPDAERPRQVIAALSAGTAGRLERDPRATQSDDDLRARIEKLLADAALSGAGVGEAFLQLNRAFAQQQDKLAVYELMRDLAKPYPSSPEAQFAVAIAAFNTGMPNKELADAAMAAVERALALQPDWDRAALLKAELLSRTSNDAAIAYVQGFLAKSPDSRPMRGALAQFFVEQKRYGEARAIFEKLAEEDPDAREFVLGVAVLAYQMKDYAVAEKEFARLMSMPGESNGTAELYLAQIAEEQKRYAEAIERYRSVPDGERGWLAKVRIAAMMGKLGRVAEARRYLADLPAVSIEQRIQVRQAEASLLREAGDHAGAYAVLQQALVEHPDSTDLLYDIAMVAEKLDRLDEAESRLRRLIELKPDDAQSLNALGYTLVDRTTRVAEGQALIERALKLAPEDAFILDSMGWALFRLGRYDEAETYLRHALVNRPDAEIAAHLGEVLWAKGDRDTARAVWQSQLKVTPDHPVLLETVRRHSP